jgi:hypothetical protein
MANRVRVFSSLLCAGALALLARPASANEPVTAGALQFGVGFRYGFELEEGDIVSPWGTGIGLELGYTLPSALYFGGQFEYFFGEEGRVLGVDVQANLWQLTAEVGYDLAVAPVFVIRPKIGVGMANATVEACASDAGCSDEGGAGFALAPGAKFMFLTENFGLSADVRYAVVFDDADTPDALILSIGIGF